MAFRGTSTSAGITQPTETSGLCSCSQIDELRTAVTVLAVMLATSIATALAFIVYRSKRWQKKGAASRQVELDEMKTKNKQLEEKIESMNWHRFFRDPANKPIHIHNGSQSSS